jgi:LysM repeat protein/ribosomal protein S27AE
MTDQPGQATSNRRLCPTCGSRVAEGATRCGVCGATLRRANEGRSPASSNLTLSIPAALGLLMVFVLLASGLTFAATRFTPLGAKRTPSATPTLTPTQSQTPAPTDTATPIPTPTPLPPLEYTVAENDTCLGLAAYYGVSVNAIIDLNRLSPLCILSVGQKLLIPRPTPTATPPPTETLEASQATEQACQKVDYTVVANDTLLAIAANYNVDMQAIMDYNGMTSENVFVGQILKIPLCARLATPGPTPTATLPPPYPAANLLLPQDGASYTLAEDTVTLQWASVGQLRDNEFYKVSVEDITEGSGRVRLDAYVTDTKYLVPVSFRPNAAVPHIMRWWVETVRRSGTTANGDPIYDSAGASSATRVFSWSGAATGPTPTP